MILDYTMSTGSGAAAATAPAVADEERMHINDGHTENQTDDQKGPGESKGVSACVGAEDGDDAQLGGRTGAVLQDEEEAIPVTATEYVIAARSLHAKSTAAQAKKALQNALQHIQGMEQVCSEPEEWFTEYEPHVRRLPGAPVPSFQPVRGAPPATITTTSPEVRSE